MPPRTTLDLRGLPHTDGIAGSRSELLRLLAPTARTLAHAVWDVRVHHPERVPADGPVLLACNHLATMDGPLSVVMSPRPDTYALAKEELFRGLVGRLLATSGQIPISREVPVDRTAVDRCIRVLRDGHALAIFPEGMRDVGEFRWIRSGATYLAMVTGAPIVPAAMLGTRAAGASPKSVPGFRARMHVVFGEPIRLPRIDWPRRQPVVREAAEQLRVRLAAHVRTAEELTRMPLPGAPTVGQLH